MNNGIILYKSKYGSAKKYAEWLAEDCGYELTEVVNADVKDVLRYDNVILCGAIFASGISGLSFIKKHYKRLSNKNMICFCVGASPYDENALDEIKQRNFKDRLQNIPLFYGRGAWNEDILTKPDKFLCNLLKKSLDKIAPEDCEPWQTALKEAIGKRVDWTDREYLKPVIEHIYGGCKNQK